MSDIKDLQAINEVWEDRVRRQSREEGRADGLRVALVVMYGARFEAASTALQEAIEAVEGEETLREWVEMFATRSRDEIEAAVLPAGVQ